MEVKKVQFEHTILQNFELLPQLIVDTIVFNVDYSTEIPSL